MFQVISENVWHVLTLQRRELHSRPAGVATVSSVCITDFQQQKHHDHCRCRRHRRLAVAPDTALGRRQPFNASSTHYVKPITIKAPPRRKWHCPTVACSTAHRSNRPDHWDGLMLDNFHPYPVEQNVSDCRQAIHYVVYRPPAIAVILFYWIRMKVVQQLTCLTLGRPSGPA